MKPSSRASRTKPPTHAPDRLHLAAVILGGLSANARLNPVSLEELAKMAIVQADALIKELNKEKKDE